MGNTENPKRSFTLRYIESLAPKKGRYNTSDGDVRHLFVVTHPTGRKVFFHLMKAFDPAKGCDVPRRTQIGVWPDVSIEQARAQAEKLNSAVATWKMNGYTEGQDPLEKKKRTAPSNVPTFGDLIEAYIEHHVKREANNPARAEYRVRWFLKKHFAAWHDRRIDKITHENVLTVKHDCGKHEYMANRCVEFARAIFNWSAGKNDDGKLNFWNVENPAKDVGTFEEDARERYLQPAELVRFGEELEKITNDGDDCPNCRAKGTMREVTAGVVRCRACKWKEKDADLKDFLVLALATGARRSSIFAMKWHDIQWERSVWAVPDSDSKSGESYSVSLLPVALEVLKRRRAAIADEVPYVFPGIGRTEHLVDLKKPWDAFRQRANISDVRLHDIRRTKFSYEAIAGVSLQIIGKGAGHKSLGSTEIYAKLHDEAVRTAGVQGQVKMQEMMRAAKKRLKAAERKPQRPLLAAAVGNGGR